MSVKAWLTFLLFIGLLPGSIRSQSCFNIGFEDSSFVNWEGYTGTYGDVFPSLTPGLAAGRHTIISGNPVPMDSLCDTLLPKIAPGSQFSVRLGNSSVGAEQDRLRYTVNVDSSNLIFVYASAIVLQDPGHTMQSQPFFQVRILDTAGNELDTACGKIEYFASANIPGFVQSQSSTFGPPLYRDWEFAGVDLTAYFGQEIIVEFTTKDCALFGHYGYAYIDAGCFPKEIITRYCLGKTDTINMTAPLGFEYLWSTGDTTQTLSLAVDSADSVYTVTCTSSLTGCSFELNTTTDPTYYFNFDILENSCGDASLKTTIEISRGDIANYFWDFGDSTTASDTSTLPDPTYTYPGPGKYPVKLIVDDGLGCSSDTLVDTANIYFPPVADFFADTACLFDSTHFTNLSSVSPNIDSHFNWDFGDGSAVDTTFSPAHLYGSDTMTTATLIVWSDSLQCGDTVSRVIDVFPRPLSGFYRIEPDSCVPHEVHFVNTSAGGDSLSPVISYEWSFGNTDSSSDVNPVYVYEDPGLYTVWMKATDINGCADSLTFLDYIQTYPIPVADFEASASEIHIENAVVNFTNQSNHADSYHWLFGSGVNNNAGTSSETDPVWEFTRSGHYLVTLTAISDFGCYDTATLSIRVIDDRSYLPNVITPNGDGLNDAFTFNIDPGSVSGFQCRIFNRWGMEVFRSVSPAFSWDGTVNGEALPPGVYYYDIRYRGFQEKELAFRGSVQLLR